jgi:hypothetical protein
VQIQLVSIQLMSPASGDVKHEQYDLLMDEKVSIQLMSPASGDLIMLTYWRILCLIVSIQLMSPASGDMILKIIVSKIDLFSFHSINVPSEWGQLQQLAKQRNIKAVSIQLMSPASGDLEGITDQLNLTLKFPFN